VELDGIPWIGGNWFRGRYRMYSRNSMYSKWTDDSFGIFWLSYFTYNHISVTQIRNCCTISILYPSWVSFPKSFSLACSYLQ
jgi:hypothetical protein